MRFRDLALDLESGEERLEEGLPEIRCRSPIASAAASGGIVGWGQQAEDPIGARRELRVVPVQRVAGRPVEERR